MALRRVELNPGPVGLPPAAEAFVADADARIDRFFHETRDEPLPAFVPSDARMSYAALATIRDQGLAPELTLCEWGSGFGVTTCLGAMLGYDACGLEIEPELVRHANALAASHRLAATFIHGSFVPEGGDRLAMDSGEFETLATGLTPGYDELGLDPDDFGVIYAYPWPGEERSVERLFNAYAAVGALLVTYRGINQVHVHRKVRRSG